MKTFITIGLAVALSGATASAQEVAPPKLVIPSVYYLGPAEAPGDSPLYRIGQISVVSLNAADVHSTLTGWKLGLHETNSLIGNNNTGRLLAVKSASVGVTLLLMHVLKKTGHHKAAGWIGLGASAVPAYAAIHNYRLNAGRK